jgi:iron complex outermembrane receptor protein
MKQILFVAAFITGSILTYAQKTIKGKVVDAVTGSPLSGATVSFQGKSGIKTDREGAFTLECGNATRITVSFVGYETSQHVIKNCDEDIAVALEPSSSTLANVEITATSAQNKSILYQPASITKLNPVELKRGMGLFLDDAINANVPGVIMQRRAVSSGQQINIRGYGNGTRGASGFSSNFDIQGTKVYLNGIPLTDAEGITLLDDIDFNSIGNVEVVKGPSGALYGLAIAGVVNLHTAQPEKGKTSVAQDVQLGSYGLRRYTTRFEMGGEHASILANYGYQKADGFMSHNASTKKFVNLAGAVQASEKQSVSFYAGYSDSYDERGGELTITQYNNKDYSGNPAYIMRNAHSAITSFRLGVSHTYNFSGSVSNTTTVFGTGMTNNSSSAAGWTDKNPINYGFRTTFDTKFTLGDDIGLSGITGMEAQRQNAQVVGYFMKADPTNPGGYFRIDTIRSSQYYTTGTKSLFTEWTLSLPQQFSITAGVGYSTMKIDLNDRFVRPNYTRPTHFEKSYNNMVSPHLAINKVFNRQASVYASYSRGYRAPVSSYFFVPVSTSSAFIDSSLKPEVGDQFEVGTKGSLLHDRLVYQIALFDAIFSNKMSAVAVTQGSTTLYTYTVNSGKQDNKGIEASVKYTAFESGSSFFNRVRPFANFTYSKFRYKDFVFKCTNYNGFKVAGVPPVTFNLGVDVTTLPGIYLNSYYSYRDAIFITSDNLNKTKSFGLLNAKLGIRRSLSNHFDVDAFFGVNNITGTQYYNMVFINQLPDAYLPAPLNAIYFGGINLKYNF